MLELAAENLGEMLEEVVFVGDASLGLWISDPGAPPVRPTKDVDVIVEVTTRSEFHAFEERLRRQRFDEDQEDGVICRKRHRDSGLILDVIPSAGEILGFENRWQREALPHARHVTLPSGRIVRAASPPYLLATKLEAFGSRGGGDFLGSRDFGDVVVLIDGREELVDEVHTAEHGLRRYLADTLTALSQERGFEYGLSGALLPDEASQARADIVVRPRMRRIAAGA